MGGRGIVCRITCPVCGRVFSSKTKYDFKLYTLKEFHEHMMSEHKDWINSWYEKNRKSFRYVKRECLKPFRGSKPIGYWLGGRPIFAEAPPDALEKLRNARSYYELDEALDQIADSDVFFATKIQADVLRNWLVSYVWKKVAKVEINV